ncbi:MAG TPA: hypothetical protein PKJ51_07190, partial [Methanothrix sp.]|nr:hypothetical protein [Methanothrix sp.]
MVEGGWLVKGRPRRPWVEVRSFEAGLGVPEDVGFGWGEDRRWLGTRETTTRFSGSTGMRAAKRSA